MQLVPPQAPAEIDALTASKYDDGEDAGGKDRGKALPDSEKLLYLVFRSLGLASGTPVEKSKIKFRVAVQLDPFMPLEKAVADAVHRKRQGPETRGVQADRDTALSDHGLLLNWLCSFDASVFPLMRQALFRNDTHQLTRTDKVTFWRKVAESLPAVLSVRARICTKHLTSAEIAVFGTQSPQVLIFPDPRLSERPMVSVTCGTQKTWYCAPG